MTQDDRSDAVVLELVEMGATAAIDAMIAVARTTMAQQLHQQKDKDTFLPFMGFVQALVEQKPLFTAQIMHRFITEHDLGGLVGRREQ